MYKITKDGVAVDPELYMIDEVNGTFASSENGLVIDFTGKNGWLFRTRNNCTVTTGVNCFIDTGSNCNISTGDRTVIRAHWNSDITGGENCVVIRRDTNEVIMLIAGQTIKLNDHMTEGYEVVEPIETIEIGGLKFNKEEIEKLLKQFNQLINY